METELIEEQGQAPSRPWGWWLAGATSLVVLAGIPLGYVGASRGAASNSDDAGRILAELSAEGLGVSAEELVPDGPSPAVQLDRIGDVLAAIDAMPANQKAALELYRLEAFTAAGRKAFVGLDEEEALLNDAAAWQLETKAALATLAKLEPDLDLVLGDDRLRFALDFSQGPALLLPHIMKLKELTSRLCGRALQRQFSGDGAGAWADVERSLRLVLAWQEPLLISYLVRLVMVGITVDAVERLLRTGPPPATVRGRVIDGLLLELDETLAATDAFRGELGLVLAALPESGDAAPDVREALGVAHRLPLVGRWKWSADRRAYVALMAEAIRVTRRPALEAGSELERLTRQAIQEGALVEIVFPALGKAHGKGLIVQAQLRLARMALALAREPELPAKAPLGLVDPTSSDRAPVLYLREGPGRARLWCVGLDGRDDGGRNPDANNRHTPDIVFPLTLPAKPANKPPKPKPKTPAPR